MASRALSVRPAGLTYARLIAALREIMKARRMTYRELAREIGVAEVSVKRLFTRSDGPVGRLERICEVLGISFHDLVARAHATDEVHALTEAQERFFEDHLAHFDFLGELATRRRSLADIQRLHRLSARSMKRYVADLARIGVLAQGGGEEVRLLVREPIGFSADGLLRKRLRERVLKTIASSERPPMFLTREWMATPTSLEKFCEAVRALSTELDSVAAYEGRVFPAASLTPVAVLLAMSEPATVDIPEH